MMIVAGPIDLATQTELEAEVEVRQTQNGHRRVRQAVARGSMSQDVRTVHVRIEGRVQGVGYRAWTVRMADQLGLVGWVRNRSDGAVEAVLQGAPDLVAEMLDRCAVGPPAAHVALVQVVGEGVGVFNEFTVRPTT